MPKGPPKGPRSGPSTALVGRHESAACMCLPTELLLLALSPAGRVPGCHFTAASAACPTHGTGNELGPLSSCWEGGGVALGRKVGWLRAHAPRCNCSCCSQTGVRALIVTQSQAPGGAAGTAERQERRRDERYASASWACAACLCCSFTFLDATCFSMKALAMPAISKRLVQAMFPGVVA